MVPDPRTPVIVGVGQVVESPQREVDLGTRPSPLALMVSALRAAISDTQSPVWSFDELIAVHSVGWSTADPALMVANELGIEVGRTRLTPIGGDVPQRLVHDCASRIVRGEIDAVAFVGAESLYTASRARKADVNLSWAVQSDDVAPAEMTGDQKVPFSEAERANGLVLPTEFYPLFENARRYRLGWTIAEQREQLGRLWANFARVAASNPYAWITSAPSGLEIATPSPTNRYIGFPYTKLLVANLPVDMGAAVILTSLNEAQRHGVPADQMVFPQFGAEGNDHWFVSERPTLDDSPAMRSIWSALQGFGADRDELDHIDLYSCFPTVVQTAADVIGIDPFDPSRVPTVTGGLTFAGGPGNNYVTHSIASMVTKLRVDSSALGLVTGVGWYSTKHAWGIYGSSPPQQPFRFRNLQNEIDATPKCPTRQDDGSVVVESYLVSHRPDGQRDRLVVVGRLGDGSRVISHSKDDELMARFEIEEMIATRGRVDKGLFTLR
jgi:acetyl-CoA C-acetyltransferase